jgi:hypothetical protein
MIEELNGCFKAGVGSKIIVLFSLLSVIIDDYRILITPVLIFLVIINNSRVLIILGFRIITIIKVLY